MYPREPRFYFVMGVMKMGFQLVWPNPLNAKENNVLMEAKEAGNPNARDELAAGNMRLVFYYAQRYFNTGLDVDDLVSIGSIGLMKAIDTFKLDKKIKFATYAGTCINNEILMVLRKNKKHKGTANLDDLIATDVDGNGLTLMDIMPDKSIPHFSEEMMNVEEKEEVKELMKDLPALERKALELRYLQGKTQKEAGKILDVSQSYISRLAQQAINRIRAMSHERENKFEQRLAAQKKTKGDVVAMPRIAKGNAEKAIQLLSDTRMTNKEISDATGVREGTVRTWSKEHRPLKVREELEAKLNEERIERMLAAKKAKSEQANRSVQEIPPSIKEDVQNFLSDEPAPLTISPITKAKQVYVGNLGDALNEFREQIEKEVKEKMESEMAANSEAEQTSEEPKKNKINRKLIFKYQANGTDIGKEDFIEELEQLLATFKNNEHEKVSFSMEITAD